MFYGNSYFDTNDTNGFATITKKGERGCFNTFNDVSVRIGGIYEGLPPGSLRSRLVLFFKIKK